MAAEGQKEFTPHKRAEFEAICLSEEIRYTKQENARQE